MEKKVRCTEDNWALNFLYEASKLLSSSLDYEETLSSVAKLVVPDVADWCIIDTVAEDGSLKRVTTAHQYPERIDWATSMHERYPSTDDEMQGIRKVLNTGQGELHREIDDELLKAAARNSEHAELLRTANPRSVMILPLNAHGRTLGAITFVSSQPGFYDDRLFTLGEELASRAASAVEHAKLYKALQTSEQTFRSTADSAPVFIWMSDRVGHFFYVNKPWLVFRGRDLHEEIVEGWKEGIHPDDIAETERIREEAFTSRTEFEIEYRLRRADGQYRWVLDKGVPRFDGESHYAGFTGCCIDITERNEAVQSVRQLNEELEQRVKDRTQELQILNADLEAFSYSVSHDLRAPLRSIKSFSWLLKEEHGEQLSGEAQDSLDRILSSAGRMSQLIEDLMAFAKIGRSPVTKDVIDLSLIASYVCEDIRREQRCSEDSKLIVTPNMVTYGDPRLIRVALENLIGNACKFSSKREVPIIEIGETQTEKGRTFYVRDNGVGFDPAYTHKLFEPFERLHSSDEYAGSGIGLPNVVRIVNRHGGTVWAESDVDRGASFFFTLGEEGERRQLPTEGAGSYSMH